MLGCGFKKQGRDMTRQQKAYLKKQKQIISTKTNEDDLRRYETLLRGASLDREIRCELIFACDAKREALDPPSAMAVNGDIDDIN